MRCQLSSSPGAGRRAGRRERQQLHEDLVSVDPYGARIGLPEPAQGDGERFRGVPRHRVGGHRDMAGDAPRHLSHRVPGLDPVALIVVVDQTHVASCRDRRAAGCSFGPVDRAIAAAADAQRRAAYGQQRRLLAVGAGDRTANGMGVFRYGGRGSSGSRRQVR